MITPPTKLCSVYFLDDGSILVEGNDYEPTGPGGLTSNVRARLSPELTDALIGQVVLSVLDQTKIVDGAEHDERKIVAGLLGFAGEKSWKGFCYRTKHVSVSMSGQLVKVLPSFYESDHGGCYSYRPNTAGSCEAVPEQVRDLLLEKIKECG